MRYVSALMLVLAVACGGDDAPPGPGAGIDAGAFRDGGSVSDAAAADATAAPTDGSTPDMDAGGELDAGGEADAGGPPPRPDAGVSDFDAGTPDPECFDDEGMPDPCACMVGSCADSGCGDGEVCAPNECGGSTCRPSGHRCVDDADCAEGSSCLDVGGSLRCQDPDGGCNDVRDCARGYACEEGVCIDRRVRCDFFSMDTCPSGFGCFPSIDDVAAICQRLTRQCENSAACPSGMSCVDVTGSGVKQCVHSLGACLTNAECGDGVVCANSEVERSMCRSVGPCAQDEDCGSGFECVDHFGDGLMDCVPTGGECSRSSDCDPGELCGSVAGEPRRCHEDVRMASMP